MRPIDADAVYQEMVRTIVAMMRTKRWMRSDKDNEDEILLVIQNAPTLDYAPVKHGRPGVALVEHHVSNDPVYCEHSHPTMVLWNIRCAPISKIETGTERKAESTEGFLGVRCSMSGLKKTGTNTLDAALARTPAALGWMGRRMERNDHYYASGTSDSCGYRISGWFYIYYR